MKEQESPFGTFGPPVNTGRRSPIWTASERRRVDRDGSSSPPLLGRGKRLRRTDLGAITIGVAGQLCQFAEIPSRLLQVSRCLGGSAGTEEAPQAFGRNFHRRFVLA